MPISNAVLAKAIDDSNFLRAFKGGTIKAANQVVEALKNTPLEDLAAGQLSLLATAKGILQDDAKLENFAKSAMKVTLSNSLEISVSENGDPLVPSDEAIATALTALTQDLALFTLLGASI